MTRILFVCHGNICRSPTAECVMKHLAAQRGLESEFYIESAATSSEELGSPVHHEARRVLTEKGVPLCGHRAVQLKKTDYARFDLILGMDSANIRNILRIVGKDPKGKVRRLHDFGASPHDVADPWYTGKYALAYDDIYAGCVTLLDALSAETPT